MELFDREAERSLLGSILRNDSVLDSVSSIVKPEHFSWNSYATIYETMLICKDKHLKVDSIVVGSQLATNGKKLDDIVIHDSPNVRGRKALTDIRGSEDTMNPSEYSVIIKNYAQKRLLMGKLSDVAKDVGLGRDLKNIVSDLSTELLKYDLTYTPNTNKFDKALSDAYDQTSNASNGSISYIPTGFQSLDKIVVGFSAPDLTIVAARPGVGKTAFIANILYSILNNTDKTAVLFTLEMSAPQMAMRFITLDSGITFHKQRTGQMADHELDKYHQSIANLEGYKERFYLNDMEAISVGQMRSELRKLPKVDIIFVDYLQLASPDKEGEHRHTDVANIVRSLKGMAKEFNIPVVACAQISRDVEKRGKGSLPILSDLAESVAIEQTADVIMFLHRAKDENEIMSDETKVIVAKQRNGPLGHITLDYQGETTRFLRHI